jgi:hypothetical protein
MSPLKKNDPMRRGYSATTIKNLANQIGQRANKAVNKALRSGYSATSMKNLIAQFEKKAGVRK